MNPERKDGGAAFPATRLEMVTERTIDGAPVGVVADVTYPGMTLRDWFAGQALIGLMSDPGMRPGCLEEFQHMALRLYQVADAMLAERSKP